jgi:hypothetical protein
MDRKACGEKHSLSRLAIPPSCTGHICQWTGWHLEEGNIGTIAEKQKSCEEVAMHNLVSIAREVRSCANEYIEKKPS